MFLKRKSCCQFQKSLNLNPSFQINSQGHREVLLRLERDFGALSV